MQKFKQFVMLVLVFGVGLLAYRMFGAQQPTPKAPARHHSSQAEATKSKRDVGMAYDAQILAMRYWQNLNDYRANLGLPPFDNAIRPGFGIEDAPHSELIPIYSHRGD
jgi:hypothetical protein